MGAVYVGVHELIGKQAAIKVLLPDLSNNKEIVRRFFNEAKATSQISHPGIVQIFDFGYHTSGLAFIVMELLRGETLRQRLQRGVIAPDHVIELGLQLAEAIAAAHEAGIIHRDLKPANLYLEPDTAAAAGERVRVLDFGIAKLTEGNRVSERTMTGAVMGTPTYMSPEQCRGAGQVDSRTDIYSIGCILFEMLIGRPPFVREGVGELISDHLRSEPPDPRKLRGDIPKPLAQLILGMLAKEPDRRPPTMRHVAAQLAGLAGAGGGVARTTGRGRASTAGHHQTTLRGASGQYITQGPGRSRAWIGILAGAVAAMVLVVIAVVSLSGGSNSGGDVSANESRADEATDEATGEAGDEDPAETTAGQTTPDEAPSAGLVATAPIDAAPAPAPIKVHVVSKPVARALIGGRDLGPTPVDIEVDPDSTVKVELVADDHERETVTLDGSKAEVRIELEPEERVAATKPSRPRPPRKPKPDTKPKTDSKPKPKKDPSAIVVD